MNNIQVHGLLEVHRRLENLPVKIHKNILSSMVNAGAKVVRNDAAARVGIRKTEMKARKSRSKSIGGKLIVSVGPTKDKFYLRFIEEGAEPHVMRVRISTAKNSVDWERKVMSDGNTIYGFKFIHPGIRPRPFLRPALFQNEARIIAAMAEQGRKRLAKEAAKK